MFNPPHPGRILRQMYLEPLGLSITELAVRLGVSRHAVSQIINEHTRISPQMAWRLATLWGTTAHFWSGMQEEYDLWQAKNEVDLSQIQAYSISQE